MCDWDCQSRRLSACLSLSVCIYFSAVGIHAWMRDVPRQLVSVLKFHRIRKPLHRSAVLSMNEFYIPKKRNQKMSISFIFFVINDFKLSLSWMAISAQLRILCMFQLKLHQNLFIVCEQFQFNSRILRACVHIEKSILIQLAETHIRIINKLA